MQEDDVERVRLIFQELFPVALLTARREMEAAVMASVATRFEAIENRVESHHSENRARFQSLDLQNEQTGNHLVRQDAAMSRIETAAYNNGQQLFDFKGLLLRIEGKLEGKQEVEQAMASQHAKAVDDRATWIRWGVATAATASAGLWAWIKGHSR